MLCSILRRISLKAGLGSQLSGPLEAANPNVSVINKLRKELGSQECKSAPSEMYVLSVEFVVVLFTIKARV